MSIKQNRITNSKIKQAIEKYKNLELRQFLENVLKDIGYDAKRVDNVYINELVELPNVWGCLKRDRKYITYATDYKSVVSINVYVDPYDFFSEFFIESSNYCKYEVEIGKQKTSII